MPANKYPRIGKYHSTEQGGLCVLCGENKAHYRVIVEVSHMRGDDQVYKVHKTCVHGKRDSDVLVMLLTPAAG